MLLKLALHLYKMKMYKINIAYYRLIDVKMLQIAFESQDYTDTKQEEALELQ